MHVLDKSENIWPLRSVMAKILERLISDEFSVSQMTYREDLSKTFNFYFVL